MPPYRVIVYIDGFNLYHAIDELGEASLKWLDLWALCEKLIKTNQTLTGIKYFSAYATWRPASHKRHRDYVAALAATGVEPILGQFKKKFVTCKSCGAAYVTHEEKETDVNIGAHLMADALRDRFDTALVLSADTDLAAAMALVRREVGDSKRVLSVAPPNRFRRGRELNPSFEITKGKLRASMLPDAVMVRGRRITRPDRYK